MAGIKKLEPCPFCGGKARTEDWAQWSFEYAPDTSFGKIPDELFAEILADALITDDGKMHDAYCDKCHSTTEEFTSEELAIAAWNRRVPKTNVREQDGIRECPFCGGMASVEIFGMTWEEMANFEDDGFDRWYTVVCNDCHAAGSDATSEERAIAAWNRRATNGLD